MRLVGVIAGICVSLLIASFVFASVAGDVAGLAEQAWWAPAVVLVVPGVMLVLWLRERG